MNKRIVKQQREWPVGAGNKFIIEFNFVIFPSSFAVSEQGEKTYAEVLVIWLTGMQTHSPTENN